MIKAGPLNFYFHDMTKRSKVKMGIWLVLIWYHSGTCFFDSYKKQQQKNHYFLNANTNINTVLVYNKIASALFCELYKMYFNWVGPKWRENVISLKLPIQYSIKIFICYPQKRSLVLYASIPRYLLLSHQRQ